jgi:hypothetical protein
MISDFYNALFSIFQYLNNIFETNKDEIYHDGAFHV